MGSDDRPGKNLAKISGLDDGEDRAALPAAPRGFGIRHLQMTLIFLGMLIGFALRVGLSVAIVAMTESESPESPEPAFPHYSWEPAARSYILSSFFWGYTLMQLPSGYLGNNWSAKSTLAIGLLVCSLSNSLVPLLAARGGWPAVCLGRAAMGLSQACLYPCCQTLLARWCPPQERARLGTFAYAGAQMGTVVALPISGLLASSKYGWPSIFYVFGALGILWAIVFFFFGSDHPSTHPFISEPEKSYIKDSLGRSSSQGKLETPWRDIFTSAPFLALIVVHCAQNWGFWLLLTEIPTYLGDVVGFDIKNNGLISALPYLAMWLLSFPMSWASDYALTRGLLSRGAVRKLSNSVAHWGPGIALLVLCFVNTRDPKLPVILLVVAVGLNAGSICGYQINHIDLSPNFAGTLMSVTNCVAGVVAILAPIICGKIVTIQGNLDQWHQVFFVSALIYFLGNAIFVLFGQGEIQRWNDPRCRSASFDNRNDVALQSQPKDQLDSYQASTLPVEFSSKARRTRQSNTVAIDDAHTNSDYASDARQN